MRTSTDASSDVATARQASTPRPLASANGSLRTIPIYHFSAADIRRRVGDLRAGPRPNQAEPARFVWTSIPSVEELGRVRMQAMDAFLADYPAGVTRAATSQRNSRRYRLPTGVRPGAVLALSVSLQRATGRRLSSRRSRELARVAREVRVFPLLALGGGTVAVCRGAVSRRFAKQASMPSSNVWTTSSSVAAITCCGVVGAPTEILHRGSVGVFHWWCACHPCHRFEPTTLHAGRSPQRQR